MTALAVLMVPVTLTPLSNEMVSSSVLVVELTSSGSVPEVCRQFQSDNGLATVYEFRGCLAIAGSCCRIGTMISLTEPAMRKGLVQCLTCICIAQSARRQLTWYSRENSYCHCNRQFYARVVLMQGWIHGEG